MHSTKRFWGAVLMLMLALALSGCITVNPGFRQPTASATPQTLEQFNAELVAAIVGRNVDALRDLMGDPFVLALWQNSAQELSADEAFAELQAQVLEPAQTIAFVSDEIVQGWLGGADPLAIWPPATTVVDVIGVSFTTSTGVNEAILAVTEDDGGEYAWSAALVAPGGFAAAPAGDAPIIVLPGQPSQAILPTDVTQVLVIGRVGIFDGPGSTYTQIGVATRGDTYRVLGISPDGLWWAIMCDLGVQPCWIGANPTFVLPVDPPPPPGATATPRPSATPRPTATQAPPPSYPIRINFRPGQTSAVVSGPIAPWQAPQYVLFAQANQTMRILVTSPSPTTNFSVRGVSDGVLYKSSQDPLREWSFVVPRSQDYLITLSTSVNTSFVMEVTISPLSVTATPTATPAPVTPERINFPSGATSVVRSGSLPAAQIKQYVFRASAGQQTRVLLSSPGGQANFALMGVTDGVTYKPFSNPAREFSLVLPRTQDYLLSINGPAFIDYVLELTIQPTGPTPTATTAPVAPERIDFPPGATSVTRSNSLPASQLKQYVFRASAGQPTHILLDSPGGQANFSVQGVTDGVTYKPLSNPAREFSFVLPRSQDYLITISGPAFINFLLELTIQPAGPTPTATTAPVAPERINFPSGATSVTRSGSLPASQLKQYVFRASAGQPTRILLDSPGGQANFSVQGVTDGVTYKPLSNPSREFSFVLPRSQDYLISISGPAFINFLLELTIQPAGPTPTATTAPVVPERITFAPGATSATRSGSLWANTPRAYIFGAAGGQTARIIFSSPSPAAAFSVRGASDGVTYKSMADPSRDWSFGVPSNQDYVITIQAPVNTSFTLQLIIPPAAPPTVGPPTLTPTATPTLPAPPVPTETATATTVPTELPTNVPTATATATDVPTLEPTATATLTLEPTATETPTLEPTATDTPTLEPTATETPTLVAPVPLPIELPSETPEP